MIGKIDFNDNEIIYLIKSGNEDMFSILIKKYRRFIHGRIYEMNLNEHDDCFQEGLLVLYNAVMTFDDRFNKSFMKYFEKLLNHRLLDIKRMQERENEMMYSSYLELDNFRAVREDQVLLKRNITIDSSFLVKLTDSERIIFEDYFLNNIPIDEIEKKHNINKKIIYYTIYRIKRKIKKYMVK